MKKIILLSALCALIVLIVGVLQASFSTTSLNLLPVTNGVYAQEPQADFVWTTSQAVFPMPIRSGPSRMHMRLSAGMWPDRPAPSVTLVQKSQPLVSWQPTDAPRHYWLLLAPYSSQLTLESSVMRPPRNDPRFLGLRLYSAELVSTGFGIGQALALGLGMALLGLITFILRWAIAHGWALPLAVTLLALGLRLLGLEHVPAGFFQDEAVSIVDANSLLQTGRDHYGVWMPLGAFEAFGDWVSPLLTYIQLPFALVLGTTPLAARLPAALAGTLAVPALYGLARSLGIPRSAALLAALAAAVSPWQILRSRVASPPALVPLCWTLCLWAGVMLIRDRSRRAAVLLALASGISLYSYPTMKLAVPLLTASALLLAALPLDAGRQASNWLASMRMLLQRWWPAALLLIGLWLPFAQLTLFNANSSMRASRKILQAESASAWLLQWLDGYSRYFRPEFYFLSGDAANGISAQGVELGLEALLVLPGLVLLLSLCAGKQGMLRQGIPQSARLSALLVLIALLIAPLPASLMAPNPQLTRALIMAPMFALLVGMGSWVILTFLQHGGIRIRYASALLLLLLGGGILGQGLARFEDYWHEYPTQVARKYQDGMREAVALLVQHAVHYDAVWIDDSMPFPYIYVLAAGGVSPQETQATLLVDHPGTTFNTVHRVGKYTFRSLKDIPYTLPTLVAIVNSLGEPGYVLQVWEQDGQRILLLRRMIR